MFVDLTIYLASSLLRDIGLNVANELVSNPTSNLDHFLNERQPQNLQPFCSKLTRKCQNNYMHNTYENFFNERYHVTNISTTAYSV